MESSRDVRFYEVTETVHAYFATKPTTHTRVMIEVARVVDGVKSASVRIATNEDKAAHPGSWAEFEGKGEGNEKES